MKRILVAMIALMLSLAAHATVSNPANSVSYACDGSTAIFTVNYPYISYTDLFVTSTTGGGVVTTLTYVTDYSVSATSTSSTASITLTNPAVKCPSGSTLKITRLVPYTQPYGFRGQTTYNPVLHETAYDRIEMQVQQIANADGGVADPANLMTLNTVQSTTVAGAKTFQGGLTSTGLASVNSGAGVQATGAASSTGGSFNGGSNGTGVSGTGNGVGAGVSGTGGTTGTGVIGTGGSSSAAGVQGFGGTTNGVGVVGTGAGTGTGVVAQGGGSSGAGVTGSGGLTNGSGVVGTGSGTGVGVQGTGGGTSSTGVKGVGGSTNGQGVQGVAAGTGNGVVGQTTGGLLTDVTTYITSSGIVGAVGTGTLFDGAYSSTGVVGSGTPGVLGYSGSASWGGVWGKGYNPLATLTSTAGGPGVVGTGGSGYTPDTGSRPGGNGGSFQGGSEGAAGGGGGAGVAATGGPTGGYGVIGTGGTGGGGGSFIPGSGNSPVVGTIRLASTTNAPSAPGDGDLWVTPLGLGVRANGITSLLSNNPLLTANSVAGQVIANGATTIVVFGTVETDSDSAYNAGTGRFTVPTGKGGDYQISAYTLMTTTQAGGANLAIFKNAVVQKHLNDVAAQTNGIGLGGSVTARLAAGDIIDARFTNLGAGGQTLSNVAANVWISIKRIP